MVIRKWLKAGVISYIWLTEGVNGSGISKGLRVSVGRGRLGWFGGESERRASRCVGASENG